MEQILSLFSDYITSETLSIVDNSLIEGDVSKEVDMDGLVVNMIVKR